MFPFPFDRFSCLHFTTPMRRGSSSPDSDFLSSSDSSSSDLESMMPDAHEGSWGDEDALCCAAAHRELWALRGSMTQPHGASRRIADDDVFFRWNSEASSPTADNGANGARVSSALPQDVFVALFRADTNTDAGCGGWVNESSTLLCTPTGCGVVDGTSYYDMARIGYAAPYQSWWWNCVDGTSYYDMARIGYAAPYQSWWWNCVDGTSYYDMARIGYAAPYQSWWWNCVDGTSYYDMARIGYAAPDQSWWWNCVDGTSYYDMAPAGYAAPYQSWWWNSVDATSYYDMAPVDEVDDEEWWWNCEYNGSFFC